MQLKDYLLDVITRYVMRQRVAKIPTDDTENDKEFVLFMEYCNDANYFDEKLVNVSVLLYWSNSYLKLPFNIQTGLARKHSSKRARVMGL